MITVIIELPWMPDELFPNKRLGRKWQYSNNSKDAYKYQCGMLSKGKIAKSKLYAVRITFNPPIKSGKQPDLDNCLSAFKSGLDAMCKANGIDDKQIYEIVLTYGERVKQGFVQVKFMEEK